MTQIPGISKHFGISPRKLSKAIVEGKSFCVNPERVCFDIFNKGFCFASAFWSRFCSFSLCKAAGEKRWNMSESIIDMAKPSCNCPVPQGWFHTLQPPAGLFLCSRDDLIWTDTIFTPHSESVGVLCLATEFLRSAVLLIHAHQILAKARQQVKPRNLQTGTSVQSSTPSKAFKMTSFLNLHIAASKRVLCPEACFISSNTWSNFNLRQQSREAA